MKKLNYLLSLAVLVIILASAGCGGSDGPGVPADDQVGLKLTSVWRIDGNTPNSVTFSPPLQDRTDSYSDFKLTITYDPTNNSGTYSIDGGPLDGTRPFKVSGGTWEFGGTIDDPNQPSFNIVRNDGLSILIEQLTDTNLQMSFNFDPADHESSRTEAVEGTWVFSFIK